jgi:DNA helicase IV
LSTDKEIALEQDLVDRAYARLESMREHARIFAASAAANSASAGPERDAMVESSLRRAQQLNIGDETLVFGRLDNADGSTNHIGRVAVYDEDHEPLVTDWRAPAAIPFYKATPKDTMNVVRRRHILGRGQRVVHLEDELLDREDLRDDLVLVGEAALLNALERSRSGHMRDIVSTIQREQDDVIRAPLQGVLVVQGGPGTGKTAVALHRAAYLLYTHRDRLTRTGVLVVGPNALFLRYIEQVLPSLGESATLSTIGGLVGDVHVTVEDPPSVARIKGDPRMAQVIARACSNIEQGLREPVKIVYEGTTLTLSVAASNHMIKLARQRLHGTHNARAEDVRGFVIEFLYRKWHNRGEWRDVFGPEHFRTFESDMREHPAFIAALEHMWPVRSGADILTMLRTDADFRARATNGILSERDAALLADDRAGFSEHDVALIDEANAILGPSERRRRRRPRIDREERFHIERLVDELQELNPIIRSERRAFVQRLIDQRLELENDERDVVPRQRPWFGHVVVDEAQSLSPMQWRMIARRCPGKSITIVGDLGQSASVWNTTWEDVVHGLNPPGSTISELSINYRSPEEISDLATRVLHSYAPHLTPPRSVRRSGEDPVFVRTDDRIAVALEHAKRLVPEDGTAAIIATPDVRDEARQFAGIEGVDLGSSLSVLSVDEARGLEFDVVVVIEPAGIAERNGLSGLYVALTRPTKSLVVVHSEQLPDPLRT